MTSLIAGYQEFEFDLPKALLAQLVDRFSAMSYAPLLSENIATIPQAQGVYQLLFEDVDGLKLVYVGKTDAEAGLYRRLTVHSKKTQHRQNLDPAKVFFKAIRVLVFTAIDLETQLIAHYGTPTWNNSGFGSNDPGRNRDTTNYTNDHFYTRFPVDVDRPLSFPIPMSGSAVAVLNALKEGLPYLFRFQRADNSNDPHPDLSNKIVAINSNLPLTPASVIRQVAEQLEPGWRATMLPSHLIMYKNDGNTYTRSRPLGVSPGTI